MDCCHIVQQNQHYVRNLRRYSIGKTANSSILTTPLRFDDSNLKNALEYLQMIYNVSCQKLESLTYISAAYSMSLCLLLFTQLFLKVKRPESRSDGQKWILA